MSFLHGLPSSLLRSGGICMLSNIHEISHFVCTKLTSTELDLMFGSLRKEGQLVYQEELKCLFGMTYSFVTVVYALKYFRISVIVMVLGR